MYFNGFLVKAIKLQNSANPESLLSYVSRAFTRRCFIKKVVRKISRDSQKNPLFRTLFLNKFTESIVLLKKRLWYKCPNPSGSFYIFHRIYIASYSYTSHSIEIYVTLYRHVIIWKIQIALSFQQFFECWKYFEMNSVKHTNPHLSPSLNSRIGNSRISIYERHLSTTLIRGSRWQMFFKIGTLKNFADFTGKHLCWSLC